MDDMDEVFSSFGDFAKNKRDNDDLDSDGFVPNSSLVTLKDLIVENKNSCDYDVFSANMVGRHAERFDHILSKMNARDFTHAYLAALPYIKAKIKPVEMKVAKTERVLNINVNMGNKKL